MKRRGLGGLASELAAHACIALLVVPFLVVLKADEILTRSKC